MTLLFCVQGDNISKLLLNNWFWIDSYLKAPQAGTYFNV